MTGEEIARDTLAELGRKRLLEIRESLSGRRGGCVMTKKEAAVAFLKARIDLWGLQASTHIAAKVDKKLARNLQDLCESPTSIVIEPDDYGGKDRFIVTVDADVTVTKAE